MDLLEKRGGFGFSSLFPPQQGSFSPWRRGEFGVITNVPYLLLIYNALLRERKMFIFSISSDETAREMRCCKAKCAGRKAALSPVLRCLYCDISQNHHRLIAESL